ncbi:MAG: glycosyltransferase [Desulfobacterales bacterium]
MKILFFIDGISNPYAGTESQFIQLVTGLNDASVITGILTLKPSPYLHTSGLPCRVEEIGSTRISSMVTWLKIFSRAVSYKRKGYKLVQFFFNDTAIIGPFMFRLAGFKTITSRRDMGIWYTPFNMKLLRYNRRFTDAYIANSEAVKRHVCTEEGAPANKVHVIYNGYSGNEAKDGNPESLGMPFGEDHLVLGMVANLRPVKRIPDAIRALDIVHKKYPEIRLVVVGDHNPNDSGDIFQMTRDLGLEDVVYFAGQQTDVKPWIAFFDICLLCSESEGFSNAIIEYMQAGRPVVCSRVGGNTEIVRHGENGLLYEKGNINELASCIEHLAADHDERSRMGRAGAAAVRDRFSFQRMVQKHVKLYESLV